MLVHIRLNDFASRVACVHGTHGNDPTPNCWAVPAGACAHPTGTTDYDKNPATACNNCQLGIGYTDKAGNTGKCLPVRKCAAGKEAIPFRKKNAACADCAKGTFRSTTMAQYVPR